MTKSRKILLLGGLALASFSMLYGVYYAVFIEHQTLDGMGGSLSTSFVRAAERNTSESQAALSAYVATKYKYVRHVDAHSHWIGLAMVLIVLGGAFDAVAFAERLRQVLAWSMLLGSVLFPLAVILQTVDHGSWTRWLAVFGSALVTASLAGVVVGFARVGPD
jgi:hypothetical protein